MMPRLWTRDESNLSSGSWWSSVNQLLAFCPRKSDPGASAGDGGVQQQSYSPFRQALLTPADLRRLNTVRSWIAVRDTFFHWMVIVACWSVVAVWPTVWTVGLAFVVIGVSYYGLQVILHDGLHRQLFKTTRANDIFNDLFLAGPICAITRLNRDNHMRHHHATCLADDPDRYKYVHADKEVPLPFLLFLTGARGFYPAVRNVFFRPKSGRAPARRSFFGEYSWRDLAVIACWQVALIGGLSYFIGWWAYPVLWVAPIYVFAYLADLIRVFCEHSMLTSDAEADEDMRLITYRSNWLEAQFFAPHNMNFHMVHHLWPSIPYYNLPGADKIVRQSEFVRSGDHRLIWRNSYLAYLGEYYVWRRAHRDLRAPLQA